MSAINQQLLSVSALQPLRADPKLRVVDCRFRLTATDWGQSQYRQGHIPGAVYAHLDRDLAGPVTVMSGRHPLPGKDDFLLLLSSWGIEADSHIVCYDHGNGAVAGRLWWLLRHWLGLEQVSLLDGGWTAWCHHDLGIETGHGQQHVTPLLSFTPHDYCWLATEQVLANLDSGEYCLLDARGCERFAGVTEPIDPIAGHIPFALNRPLTENVTDKGFFKSAQQLKQEFSALLGTDIRPEQVVHSCGSGVTACHNLFAMELAGLFGSRLYPGSWSEWIRDPGRPIITARPET